MSKITRFWLLALLISLPFGQLARLPLPWPEIRIYLADVFLVLLLISHGPSWPVNWFFLTSALVSVLVHFSWPGLFYWLRLAAYCQLYRVVADDRQADCRQYLIGVGLGAAGFGLIQYFLWPDLTAATVWGWDPHYFRAVGSFLDPNFLGIILVLTLILLFERQNWLGLSFVYLTLALTYSRSAFLALLAATTAKKNFKLSLAVLLLLAATTLVLPRSAGGEGVNLARTSTVWARWENYQQAFSLIKKNFWWGTGFQTRQVDNSFLFIWANAGLASFLSWLYFLKKAFVLAKQSLWLKATLIAVLVHSFFVNSLFYPPILTWLMISLGSLPVPADFDYQLCL